MAGDHVEVDAGGGNGGMAEELLDGGKGRPLFEQAGGEVVAEGMGRHVDAGGPSVIPDYGVDVLGPDAENGTGRADVLLVDVCEERLFEVVGQGDHPVLVALAGSNVDESAGDVAGPEAGELSAAEAGIGQGEDNEGVPDLELGAAVGPGVGPGNEGLDVLG